MFVELKSNDKIFNFEYFNTLTIFLIPSLPILQPSRLMLTLEVEKMPWKIFYRKYIGLEQ